mmetsp:Transcript_3702/g.8388  ORF Transcript_3702/g.8388 Transcript_3702/m.8388 type:complete len:360 (+) Transcript_3702:189-1268(+)
MERLSSTGRVGRRGMAKYHLRMRQSGRNSAFATPSSRSRSSNAAFSRRLRASTHAFRSLRQVAAGSAHRRYAWTTWDLSGATQSSTRSGGTPRFIGCVIHPWSATTSHIFRRTPRPSCSSARLKCTAAVAPRASTSLARRTRTTTSGFGRARARRARCGPLSLQRVRCGSATRSGPRRRAAAWSLWPPCGRMHSTPCGACSSCSRTTRMAPTRHRAGRCSRAPRGSRRCVRTSRSSRSRSSATRPPPTTGGTPARHPGATAALHSSSSCGRLRAASTAHAARSTRGRTPRPRPRGPRSRCSRRPSSKRERKPTARRTLPSHARPASMPCWRRARRGWLRRGRVRPSASGEELGPSGVGL